jgi:hypothetical protein
VLRPITLKEPDQWALQRLPKQRNEQNNYNEEHRLTGFQIACRR